jgi:hypothetical protein
VGNVAVTISTYLCRRSGQVATAIRGCVLHEEINESGTSNQHESRVGMVNIYVAKDPMTHAFFITSLAGVNWFFRRQVQLSTVTVQP